MRALFLLPVFFIFAQMAAQVPPVLFDEVRDNEGNPIGDISGILRDRSGFMWVGSRDGLYRYDGRDVRLFQNDPSDSSSLPGNWVISLKEDAAGQLWLLTSNGICRYDPRRQSFRQVYPKKNGNTGGPSALFFSENGHAWYTDFSGLHEFSSNFDSLLHSYPIFDQPPAGLRYFISHTAAQIGEKDHVLWITTGQGLCRFDPRTRQWNYFRPAFADAAEAPLKMTMRQFWFDTDGTAWICSWGNGLLHFDSLTGRFESFLFTADPKVPGTENITLDVCPADFFGMPGKLLVGSGDQGLCLFDKSTASFSFFGWSKKPQTDSLFGSYVSNIFDDGRGTLWLGCGTGFYKVNSYRQRFHHVNPAKGHSPGNEKYDVTCFAEDQPGNGMYMGTYAQGVLRRQDTPGKESFDPLPGLSFRQTGFISNLLLTADGTLWIAATSSAFYYSPATHTTVQLDTAYVKNAVTLLRNTDGSIRICTRRKGIVDYFPGENRFRTFIPAADTNLRQLSTVFTDPDGSLWIGTFDRGFFQYSSDGRLLKSFREYQPGFRLYNVSRFLYDRAGNLWVSCDQGLLLTAKGNRSARLFTTADGLPSNIVTDMVDDRSGQFWLCTNHGLCLFNPAAAATGAACRNFSLKDGLNMSNYFYELTRVEDGQIFVGTADGFILFNPERFNTNPYPPPVTFTSVKINGMERGFLAADTTQLIDLAYDENQLAFEFIALNYVFPERNRYAYRLEGLDTGWTYTDNGRNVISYSSLPSGSYVFTVKACNNDGIWSTGALRLRFVIEKPFWETLWFRAAVLLLVSGIIYAIYRYRIGQLLKMERMRNKIASDLHDDIGSALSSISIYSGIAQQQPVVDEETRLLLEQIGETSRETIGNMNDMVWTINPKNDRFGNVVQRMRHFGDSLFAPLNVNFSFTADETLNELRLSMEQRKNVHLVFKEAVNNSAKYAQAKSVTADLRLEKKQLVMTITDDGKGFDAAAARDGNGLLNMKQRAAAIGGTCVVVSTAGKGTSITLRFKPIASGS